MLKFLAGQIVPRWLLAALRRMRGGPLPQVSEVDWSEWEQSVAAWEDTHGPAPDVPQSQERARRRTATPLPEVSEGDWAAWEDSVRAIEKARTRR